MANNKRGFTVECSACSWQGDQSRTDSGHCPECDGECVPLDQVYGTVDSEPGVLGTQATPVRENTAHVIGERLNGRLDGEQAQQALEVLNGMRKLD